MSFGKEVNDGYLSGKTILITGVAGFIGSFVAKKILASTETVRIIGLDNLNDYYDVALKQFRLEQIKGSMGEFIFIKANIADKKCVSEIFDRYHPDIVINLAAQAGVRYSIEHPDAYIESNLTGFYSILEACRQSKKNKTGGVKHLIFASSSSVYGNNKKIPYSVEDKTDTPVSLYAATKKSNELMAYAYSKLYDIPATGLRFFTVYGPAGRPDMAYFSFTDKLIRNEKIKIYNYGNCKRDFTYIDDIVAGILKILDAIPKPDSEGVLYKVYNIGNNHPENLLDFVEILGEELKLAEVIPEDCDLNLYKELVGMQPGDVEVTYADISELENDFGFRPQISLREGLRAFVSWYKSYYLIR